MRRFFFKTYIIVIPNHYRHLSKDGTVLDHGHVSQLLEHNHKFWTMLSGEADRK